MSRWLVHLSHRFVPFHKPSHTHDSYFPQGSLIDRIENERSCSRSPSSEGKGNDDDGGVQWWCRWVEVPLDSSYPHPSLKHTGGGEGEVGG